MIPFQLRRPNSSRISFVALLRATASLLVVYCHLVGYRAASSWFVKPYINQFIRDPLAILWDFGYLGVAVFFIISGFIIAHVAQRETRGEFMLKRLLRVYPPFLAALAVALVVNHQNISLTVILQEASLFDSRFILVGPSYTLTMEIMFYALAAVTLPLLRSKPVVATAIVAIAPALAFFLLRPAVLGIPQLERLLGYDGFVSIFAIGMSVYYGWSGRITVFSVVALIALSWCAFVWTSGSSADARSFQLNTLYAIILFLAVFWVQPKQIHRSVNAVAEGSYSLYLLHVPLGMFVIDGLEPVLGYSLALIACLVILAASCWISYTWVERPSQALARLLIARLRLLGAVGHVSAHENSQAPTAPAVPAPPLARAKDAVP